MPSPGASQLAIDLEKTFSLTVPGEGTKLQTIKSDGLFIVKLSNAMNAGWTCASPTTPSTFVSSFGVEFADYFPGIGLTFINCIATSLDAEIADWVASWVVVPGVHTYTVSADNIKGRINICKGYDSEGISAIRDTVADTFALHFEQEVG